MNNLANEHEKEIAGRDDAFNSTFPSLQNVSEDSARPNYRESSPCRLHGDISSEEALRKIRTAQSISISPGIT